MITPPPSNKKRPARTWRQFVAKQGPHVAAGVASYVVNKVAGAFDRKVSRTIEKKLNRKRKAGPTFVTTGYGGKRIKASSKKPLSVFRRKGCVFKYEGGGTITDPNAVYLMHGTCPQEQMILQVMRAVVKYLFVKAGYTVGNFNDTPDHSTGFPPAMNIRYYIRQATSASSASERNMSIIGGSYEQIASALIADIRSWVTNDRGIEILKIDLVAVIASAEQTLSSFDCENSVIHFYCTSNVKMQNITLATNTGGDANSDEQTNVENNPLVGYAYSHNNMKKNFCELKGKIERNANQVMIINDTTGVITWTYGSDNHLIQGKPPSQPQTFGMDKITRVVMKPGEIRNSYLKMQKSIRFFDFLVLYAHKFNVTQIDKALFGKVQIIGLEKMLNSRATTEPSVNIGYQNDITIGCYVETKKKSFTNDLITLA